MSNKLIYMPIIEGLTNFLNECESNSSKNNCLDSLYSFFFFYLSRFEPDLRLLFPHLKSIELSSPSNNNISQILILQNSWTEGFLNLYLIMAITNMHMCE